MFTASIFDQYVNEPRGRMQTIQAGRLDPLAITLYKVVSQCWESLCVLLRITESEQCSLQIGYWPSLEMSEANYLYFLVGGGDTDKTHPVFGVCLLITLCIM